MVSIKHIFIKTLNIFLEVEEKCRFRMFYKYILKCSGTSKKIECFASPSLAYFDRRGWTGDDETGQTTDLVQGTPVHFPVPAIDLILGGLENYTHGGTTGDFAPRIVDRGAVPPYTPR